MRSYKGVVEGGASSADRGKSACPRMPGDGRAGSRRTPHVSGGGRERGGGGSLHGRKRIFGPHPRRPGLLRARTVHGGRRRDREIRVLDEKIEKKKKLYCGLC